MPKFSVKKPLTVFVAVLAILVLGVVAYLKMTPDLLPNMDFPYVVIVTTDMGASPETVEADVTKPLEQSMATLNEIKHITSSSQNSMSMVVLEFEQGVNMDSTGVDIQQKIAALQGSWDDSVGTPYVLKINPAMLPVEIAAVSREGMDVAELSEFVEETLAGKLEGITGVASVSVGGVLQRQMNVILSQEKLDALSAKLAAAVNGQLDAAQAQLEQTRSQLLEAKSAIRTAEENAVTQAATRALESLRDSLRQMDARKTQLQEKLNELQAVLQRKAELDAKKAVYDARIAAVENDPLLTQEQKEEQIAAIKAESGYIRLESDLAELDLRLAALGADWDRLQEEIEKTAQQLRDLQEEIRRFKEDNGRRGRSGGENHLRRHDRGRRRPADRLRKCTDRHRPDPGGIRPCSIGAEPLLRPGADEPGWRPAAEHHQRAAGGAEFLYAGGLCGAGRRAVHGLRGR